MSNKPYRLAQGGRFIDRTKKRAFHFRRQAAHGFAGDTLASAVMANGSETFRPQFQVSPPARRGGPWLRGNERAGRRRATARATNPICAPRRSNSSTGSAPCRRTAGHRWPSTSAPLNSTFSRFIPGGFYYKTFMWPQRFWKHVYEPLIRRAAGLGKAPEGRDPDTYEHIHVHCDVLVIGAGVAGLAAAEAAAASGARVILADENPRFGGVADISGGTLDGKALTGLGVEKVSSLAAAENVHLLPRTTVVGHWHHNYLMLFERVADHDPALLATGRRASGCGRCAPRR